MVIHVFLCKHFISRLWKYKLKTVSYVLYFLIISIYTFLVLGTGKNLISSLLCFALFYFLCNYSIAIGSCLKCLCSSNLDPGSSFRYKRKAKKETLEHFRHVAKIYKNRGHIFQNKLQNTRKAILKILTI